MAVRPSLFHAYDLALEGALTSMLLEWDADTDVSVEDMAYRLRSDHGIRVSAATVYRWIRVAKGDVEQQAAGQ